MAIYNFAWIRTRPQERPKHRGPRMANLGWYTCQGEKPKKAELFVEVVA